MGLSAPLRIGARSGAAASGLCPPGCGVQCGPRVPHSCGQARVPQQRGLARAAAGSGGGGGGQDSMAQIRRVLGQAMREESKTGFGPPPPPDREGGAGFVNLTGIEDLMAGERQFNVPRSRDTALRADPSGAGPTAAERAEEGSDPLTGALPGDPDREAQPGAGMAASSAPAPMLDVASWSHAEKVLAAGTLGLTLAAFARGSEDLLPPQALGLLQAWALFAWAAHFGLACIVALGAQREGLAPAPWFTRVLFCGSLAFSKSPWRSAIGLGSGPKKP